MPASVGLPFEELRMGAIDEWDSLGNLNLLLAIENEFSIRLTTEQLSSIDSLAQLETIAREQANERRQRTTSREISRDVLASLGVRRGDSLLVYSNAASIAKIVDVRKVHAEFGAGARDEILVAFHRALRDCVGDGGTLMTLGLLHGLRALRQAVSRRQVAAGPKPRRISALPVRSARDGPQLQSHEQHHRARAPRGRHRGALQRHGVRLAHAWEKLIEHEAKLLFWDTTLRPMTFGHHVEQCVGVPHVYSKLYDTPIYDGGRRVAVQGDHVGPLSDVQREVQHGAARRGGEGRRLREDVQCATRSKWTSWNALRLRVF